jgi:plasmid stability protein
MSNKYAPLTRFLRQQEAPRVTMTFHEVEEVLGFSLPASAWKYPAWWSNAAAGQSQVKSWRDAGWETRDLDLRGRKVTFVRVAGEPVAPAGKKESGKEEPKAAAPPSPPAPASAAVKPARQRQKAREASGPGVVEIPAAAIDMAKLPPQARRLLESRARAAGRTAQEEAAAIISAALAEERARVTRALAEMRERTNRPGAFDLLAVMERKKAHAGD